MKILLLGITFLTFNLWASEIMGCFPENSLSKPNLGRSKSQKIKVDKLIAEFKRLNKDIIQTHLKREILVKHDWSNDRVNAFATFDWDDNPVIKILGGVSRYPGITDDMIRLILCHELGHFVGGKPKKLRGNSQLKSWSSAEGQADYFSTAICFKKYMDGIYRGDSTTEANIICNGNQDCLRSSKASKDLIKMWAEIKTAGKVPSLLDQDDTYVYQTILNYPNLQCRLDTLVNGGRCAYEHKYYLNKTEIKCVDNSEKSHRPHCWFFEQ